MKNLRALFAFVCLLLAPLAAHAQNVTVHVVTTCGSESIPLTAPAWLRMDATGVLCTSSTGGGGGSSLSFVTATLTGWTSATAANATQVLMPLNTNSYGAAISVQLDQTSTISAGAVTFEGTYDGTNWVTLPVAQIVSGSTGLCFQATNPYTLVASTNQPFIISPLGFQSVRIKLSTQITGSGTVTPFVTLLPFVPSDPALCGAIVWPATTPPVNIQATQSGAVANVISCDSHVFKHITSATDTLAVQGVTAKTVYVCGWRSRAAGVATWFLENTASTNANCSSSNTQITGVATEAANTGEVFAPGMWNGLKNTAGNGLCINSTGTGGVDVDIWYTQF